MAYESNISIGGVALTINPERYTKQPTKMGSFARTVTGALLSQDVSSRKYMFKIAGITQEQIEDLKRVFAAEFNLTLIDFIPISERGSQSRAVYEDLGNSVVNGETVYLYVPQYTVAITDFQDSYSGNTVEFTLTAEEQ